jgi:hypothetical protein
VNADKPAPAADRPDWRRDEVELYVRTYSTVLRTSGEVRLRAFEAAHRNVDASLHAAGPQATAERASEEGERGITTIAPVAGADVGAQLIDLRKLHLDDVDPRLRDLAEAASGSDAVVLNVNYPLGMGAYHVLRQVAEVIDDLQGVYVLGKAATLNGDIGDVLIADWVYDEHTRNTYSFDNAFGYTDVAPFLERGSVLDNQRAVTVKGTFLQTATTWTCSIGSCTRWSRWRLGHSCRRCMRRLT